MGPYLREGTQGPLFPESLRFAISGEADGQSVGKRGSREKTITATIESHIPRDREFNTLEIVAGLEALAPSR